MSQSIALGLTASILWGTADLIAGVASRQLRSLVVLALSQVVGLATVLPLALLLGGTPSLAGVLAASLSGCVTALGLTALYTAFARGKVSIVAAIASTGGVIPFLVGTFQGEPLAGIQGVGVIAAFGGAALVSAAGSGSQGQHSGASTLLALGAALAAGTALVLLRESAGEGDIWWAVAVARGATTASVATAIVILGVPVRPTRVQLGAVALVGTAEATASLLFALAATTGPLGIVGVIVSLYPVTTVALARLVLREVISPLQFAGTIIALAGVAFMAQ